MTIMLSTLKCNHQWYISCLYFPWSPESYFLYLLIISTYICLFISNLRGPTIFLTLSYAHFIPPKVFHFAVSIWQLCSFNYWMKQRPRDHPWLLSVSYTPHLLLAAFKIYTQFSHLSWHPPKHPGSKHNLSHPISVVPDYSPYFHPYHFKEDSQHKM